MALSMVVVLAGCQAGRSGKSVAARKSTAGSEFLVESIATDSGRSSDPQLDLVSYQKLAGTEDPGPNNETGIAVSNERQLEPAKTPYPTEPAPPAGNSNSISIEQVLESVARSYPEIEIAIGELEAAHGKVLASRGEFDSRLETHSISQSLGFYQNYQNSVGLTQPLFSGGEVFGTYRVGRGKFEPWYGERATDEGGEFKAGIAFPLLQDRATDSRRTALRSAEANRDELDADVEARLLQFQRFASQAYWDWFATCLAVQIQQKLLELAEVRVAQINERVEKGDLARLAQIDNQRFIAKRQNDLIKARRSMERASIKLSLFYRDDKGAPIIASPDQIPNEIPQVQRITDERREMEIATAMAVRPELHALNAARSEACIALQYARNTMLPSLDMKGYASQDVGPLASPLGDKRPFELNVGVFGEVPLQRREARGKIQTAAGKITQIDAKIRFVADKIRAEIQDAASAVNAALDQIEQSQNNVELTRTSLELGRQSFEAGDIDLIALNIYETAVADSELELLDARFKYFYYQVVYQTAISGQAFVQP